MNTRMTIAKRFMLLTAILIALLAGVSGVAFYGLHAMNNSVSELTEKNLPSTRIALKLQGDLLELRGEYWSHMAIQLPEGMAEVENRIQLVRTKLDTDMTIYARTMDDNDEDRANYRDFGQILQAYYGSWEQVLPLSRADKTEEAVSLFEKVARPQMLAALEVGDKMIAYNQRVASESARRAASNLARSLWLLGLFSFIAIAAGVLLSLYMTRTTTAILRHATSELSQGSEQVTSAAAQITSSSQSLSSGSAQQAASLEETSAAAHEINSMASRNSENSRQTATIVADSQNSFRTTNVLLDELLEAMQSIDGSSQKISKIIKVIDEIAFQTNILALNAAVEAARAGEAGMGFAVVADEVRALAQRCAQAARDTTSLIEESITRSSGGRVKVDRVAEAIRTLTTQAERMRTLVDEINLGSSEQARGISQISGSITEMERSTQAFAANAEESAAASEELHAQAASMHDVVGRLQALVDDSFASGSRSLV